MLGTTLLCTLCRRSLVVFGAVVAVDASQALAAPSYDPATSIVVFVHGFDPEGYTATSVYGDDATGDDLTTLADALRQPTWDVAPTAPNQVAATTYYGSTPPVWYDASDIAADQAMPSGMPRYALRVARYIWHVLERAPAATAVNIVSASMGTEVARYLIEADLLGLASSQTVTRWAQV